MLRAFLLAAIALLLTVAIARAEEPAETPYERLPVPAVTIYPGDIIVEEMLTELHFLPGTSSRFPVVDTIGLALGKSARRTLVPNRLIPANAIGEPELVSRGALTMAILNQGPLVITASVLALDAGALGDMIRVRNVDSGRVVTAMVMADGTVRVGGL